MKRNKNIKEGYKKTAVGVIPEEWEVKRLGDIGEVINGLTYSPKDVNLEGTLVLRSSNVQNRTLSFDDNVYVNTEELQYNPVKKDDILICVRNGSKNLIGKNALITKNVEDIAFGAFMSVYRSSLNSYIFQFFGTHEYQRQINRNLGATINSINNSELRDFKLPIPPLPEQQAIANCLTTWDRGIEKLTQLIATKREQKKGLMQQLLTGKKRLDGFVGEWEEVKIGEIIKLQGGYAFKSDKFKNEGIPIIRISNLSAKSLEVDFTDIVYYNKINQTNFKVVNGDLLIAMSGATTGKIAVYRNLDYAYLNQRVGLFKTKDSNKLDYRILYFIVQTSYFDNEISKMLSTGAQPNISSSDIENIKINLPPKEEQTAIAHILTTADKEISLLEKKLEAMKEEKKGLMQVLLTGEKRLIDN